MIKSKPNDHKPEIDLDGPQGNGFYLLGIAQRYCKQLNKDWEDVRRRMTSGGYENLIKVFDGEFGHLVDLYRRKRK